MQEGGGGGRGGGGGEDGGVWCTLSPSAAIRRRYWIIRPGVEPPFTGGTSGLGCWYVNVSGFFFF